MSIFCQGFYACTHRIDGLSLPLCVISAQNHVLHFLTKLCSTQTIQKEIEGVVDEITLAGDVPTQHVCGVQPGVVLVRDEVENKIAQILG